MEALAIFSLACSIMQTISFAHGTISVAKCIYRNQSPKPELADSGRKLSGWADQLNQELQRSPKPLGETEKKLLEVARGCKEAAKDLEAEIGSLVDPESRTGFRRAVRAVAIATVVPHRIARIEKSITNYQKTLETQLLVQVCSKTNALEIQQEQGFDHLSKQLQRFIKQYSLGHTSMSKLIAEETAAQLNAMELRATNKHTRERFLGSLKFPEMNARKNQIAHSYPKTYYWMLDIHEEHESTGDALAKDGSTERDDLIEGDLTDMFHVRDEEETSRDSFVNWLKSGNDLYWISGKPGSGKSTLMKFLNSRPETKEYLQSWKPEVKVLAHYLWSAGSGMHNNTKGSWCSLLHQILSFSDELTDLLLMRDSSLQQKDNHTDWDIDDLARLTKEAIGASDQAYCIFIDGLDEICQADGPDDILNLVEELRLGKSTKICVSSRAEPTFKRRLATYPQISIHTLTLEDMTLFTRGLLDPNNFGTSSSHAIFRDNLVNELVSKAEGVFLWATLVARSLRRGIENGDTYSKLKERLRNMPSGLTQLFDGMWLRLPEEDRHIYLQKATMYFDLILGHMDLHFIAPHLMIAPDANYTVFELMLASDSQHQSIHTTMSKEISVEDLRRKCEAVIRDMDVVCAGLLEVQTHDDRGRLEISDNTESLVPYTQMGVQFIHRSIYDYLTHPKKGQVLRCSEEYKKGDYVKRRFETALAVRRLFGDYSFEPKLLGEFLTSLYNFQPAMQSHIILELFDVCCFALSKGYIGRQEGFYDPLARRTSTYAADFVVYAAQHGLRDVVKKHVETHRLDVKDFTGYLYHACSLQSVRGVFRQEQAKCLQYTLESIQYLLNLGADPTMRFPAPYGIGQVLNSSTSQEVTDFTSPLGILLISIISRVPTLPYFVIPPAERNDHCEWHWYLNQVIEVVRDFNEHGVDPDIRVPVVYSRADGDKNHLEPLKTLLTSHIQAEGYLRLVLNIPLSLLYKWTWRRLCNMDQDSQDMHDARLVAFSPLSLDSEKYAKLYKVDSQQDSDMILKIVKPLGLSATKEDLVLSQFEERLPILESHLEYFSGLGWCAPEGCSEWE